MWWAYALIAAEEEKEMLVWIFLEHFTPSKMFAEIGTLCSSVKHFWRTIFLIASS